MNDLSFEIRLRLLPPDQGGRPLPISDGERPNWNLGNTWLGRPTQNDGTIFLDGIATLTPGTEGPALLVPLVEEFWATLEVGAVLAMHEGARVVGYASVTKVRRAAHFTREAAAFALQAKQFCKILEGSSELPLDERLRSVRDLLVALYAAGCALPRDVAADEIEAGPNPPPPAGWPGFERFELYWMVFDPYADEAPVAGELSDDLLDIYYDLTRGLALWRSPATRAAALWEWRFHFDVHWSAHAVQALNALHRACASG